MKRTKLAKTLALTLSLTTPLAFAAADNNAAQPGGTSPTVQITAPAPAANVAAQTENNTSTQPMPIAPAANAAVKAPDTSTDTTVQADNNPAGANTADNADPQTAASPVTPAPDNTQKPLNIQSPDTAATASAPANTDTATAGGNNQVTSATGAENSQAQNTTNNPSQAAAVSPAQVTDFAGQAVVATFSYSYKTYQDDLKKMQSYFTQEGWQSFYDALKASNNLTAVQREKLTVSAKISGDVNLLNQGQTDKQQWLVQVPVHVTYKNEKNQAIEQDLQVKLIIAADASAPNHLGIRQYVAVPAAKSDAASS